MPFDRPVSLPSPTGATIWLYRQAPSGAPKAVIQVNHGLAEHAARYERFADFLAEHGFATYAHDHRGHGITRAPDAPLGQFARDGGTEKVLGDVLAVHDQIARNHPGLPVILFGHSMGGLIALNFLQRHPDRLAGAAIWNANFTAGAGALAARAILAWERFRLGSDVPSRLLPRLTFGAWGASIPQARTPFDWLSRDKGEVDKYIADPLCGWSPSVSMWQDVFRFISAGADDRNLRRVPRDLPLLLVGGGSDLATGNGAAVKNLAKRLSEKGFSNLETRIYAETRHESLNELNRNMIMADFVDWAERAIAGPSTIAGSNARR